MFDRVLNTLLAYNTLLVHNSSLVVSTAWPVHENKSLTTVQKLQMGLTVLTNCALAKLRSCSKVSFQYHKTFIQERGGG